MNREGTSSSKTTIKKQKQHELVRDNECDKIFKDGTFFIKFRIHITQEKLLLQFHYCKTTTLIHLTYIQRLKKNPRYHTSEIAKNNNKQYQNDKRSSVLKSLFQKLMQKLLQINYPSYIQYLYILFQSMIICKSFFCNQ